MVYLFKMIELGIVIQIKLHLWFQYKYTQTRVCPVDLPELSSLGILANVRLTDNTLGALYILFR